MFRENTDQQTCNTRASADKHDARIAACDRLIAGGQFKGPELARLHERRADAWARKGDDERWSLLKFDESSRSSENAIRDYDEAIRLDPRLAIAFQGRGTEYRLNGQHDKALRDVNQAIKLDPKLADAYTERGLVYLAKNDPDRAIRDFDQAIRLDPGYGFAYRERGNAYAKKRNYDRAIKDYDEAIRLDPKDTNAYFDRADAFESKGDKQRAKRDRDEAARLGANNLAAPLFPPDPGKVAAPNDFLERKPQAAAPGPAAASNPIRTLDDLFVVPPDPGAPIDFSRLKPSASSDSRAAPPQVAAAPAALPPPVSAPLPAFAGRRIALVIGNSAYSSFPKIPNPLNDAQDLAAVLKTLGFEVTLGTDLNRADMEERLIRFSRQARDADTALIFYAGHGLQHQGVNYLVPVDGRIEDETDLRKLVKLQDVMGDLHGARVRILIVDACRDNGVVQQLAGRMPATRSAAFSRGFAPIEGTDGTLVAFATQPNRVAADGKGRNSPFTQALLKHLPTPGLDVRVVMTRVRTEVVAATGGTQRPEVWDSLAGEFAFK